MSTSKGPTVALLAIGDEILSGEILNANAAFLSERLAEIGFVLRGHVVVSDTPADIKAALSRLSVEADVVMCTGGLGPTEDDRTVDVVAEMLGTKVEPHAPSLDAMKSRFSAHGFEMTPNNLRQVRVPVGAEALPNAAGIAPGFHVTIDRARVFFFPGVPREMERIFNDHVVAWLLRWGKKNGLAAPAVRTFHVYGMGESHIDHRLAGLVNDVPGATVHFRTAFPENHVKVVVRGADAKSKLEALDDQIRRRIGTGIYGIDAQSFAAVVGQAFREAGATLALAESCTGGYAGTLLTDEPGASDFFRGSIVSYANDVKVKVLGVKPETISEFGAVSESCAKEMAEGARRVCDSTFAVSITGIAGSAKEGETAPPPAPGEKPVGTVCFAVAGPKTTKTTSKFFSGSRDRIRRAAAYFALELARKTI